MTIIQLSTTAKFPALPNILRVEPGIIQLHKLLHTLIRLQPATKRDED